MSKDPNKMEDYPARLLRETTLLVEKDFLLQGISDTPVSYLTEEELILALSEGIYHAIESDMEKLFTILYRLDVDEQKVHKALLPSAPEYPHIGIARLIVARQKQRAATRLYYAEQEKQSGNPEILDNEDGEKW